MVGMSMCTEPGATSPRSIRERLRRDAWCSTGARGSCRWRRRSTTTTSRDRGGSSTIPRRSGATCSRSSARRWRRPSSRRPTSARSGSPTSARRRCCGIARPGRRCTTRSTGRTPAPTSCAASSSRERGQDRFREKTGLPLATYFSGPKVRWLLDQRPGPARARRGGRGAVRHDRLVADLEPVRPPRHRRDQRQPHDADGPATRREWDDELLTAMGVPAGDAPGDPPVVGDLRRGGRAAGGRAGRLAARRPARRAGRPDLL